MKDWSNNLKDLTRRNAGDGAILKNRNHDFGFYVSRSDGGINILGTTIRMGMPCPTDKVLASFGDMEELISAGWVLD